MAHPAGVADCQSLPVASHHDADSVRRAAGQTAAWPPPGSAARRDSPIRVPSAVRYDADGPTAWKS